jgi:hypothetical protein
MHRLQSYAGKSYVIFGKTDTGAIDLSKLGGGSKYTIDYLGDKNANTLTGTHALTIKSSKPSPLTSPALETAGTGGFVINGESTRDYSGDSVSSAGDVNGDGLQPL